MSEQTKEILFEIQDLNKYFVLDKRNTLKAVNHVSLTIHKGETVGIVGESGCGKTTLGRTIKRLYRATSGKVLYKGQDIFSMNKAQAHQYAKNVQMIFQDPYSSLDPRMTVREIIREGMLNHDICKGDRAAQDKPTSALDVSIQAQVINLLKSLQEKFDLTLIFISHNLSLVKYISDRVGVMYLGSMVELSTADDLYEHPAHPYTQALISAIPIPDPVVQKDRKIIELKGDIPSPINTPDDACSFASRCPYATPECAGHPPRLEQVGENHFATCDRVMKGEQAV